MFRMNNLLQAYTCPAAVSFGLGVPVFRRWDEDRDDPVPGEVLLQLWGRQASPLLEIEWEGGRFRVSSIDLPAECQGSNDYLIPFDHTPRWLSIVACDSIDIDLPGV